MHMIDTSYQNNKGIQPLLLNDHPQIPSARLLASLKKARDDYKKGRLKRYSSVDEAFPSLT